MPLQQPLHTSNGRAQALLRLSRPVLHRLTQSSQLHQSLQPFRCKPTDVFSATTFIHSFGCQGPTEQDWHTLFASAHALRPEDLSVILAYITCPDNVDAVVLGSPGILQLVCRLWDEWLVEEAIRITGESVEEEAAKWAVEKSAEGFVWIHAAANGVTTQCLLASSVDIVGMGIVKHVMRRVVGDLLERTSLGGQERFMEMLAARANIVDIALGRAKTVLLETVFHAAGQRTCYTA